MANDSYGSTSDHGLKQRILESIEKRIEKLMMEADIDGDGNINFLEFHEAIRKIPTKTKNQNNLSPSKPPDGGWGWLIVLSCFACNLIIGILHMKMSKKFNSRVFLLRELKCQNELCLKYYFL